MKARLGAILVVACVAFTAGCDDRKRERELGPGDVVDLKPDALKGWIRRNDDINPALWLASKEAGHPLSIDDPAVVRLSQAFHLTATRFLESDRMAANRTAQLAEMLANDGKPEDAAVLIENLASVVNVAHGKGTYGELCQFYLTLRHDGADRGEALSKLQARYGFTGKEIETGR